MGEEGSQQPQRCGSMPAASVRLCRYAVCLVGRLQDPPTSSSARSGDSSARAPDVPVAGPAARRQQASLVRRPRERLDGGGVLAEAPQRRPGAARARRPDGHRVVVAAAGQLRVAGRPLRAGAAWSGAAGLPPGAVLPRCPAAVSCAPSVHSEQVLPVSPPLTARSMSDAHAVPP